jgi:flagellar biosynthetic protein FlhB
MGITPSLSLIVLALLATGVVATVSQTGFLWATKKVGFDLSKLNPMPGIKRLFSSQGIFELVKALLKLSLVGFVVYNFLRGRVPELLDLGQMELLTGMSSWAVLAGDLALQVAEVYLVLAVGDYVYQRWRYDKSMKMSKEEVKEEMKQNEGDPFLKGRIRSQQRKMARMRMMSNVKKADVIITNPTHLAIAIQYDPQTMRAPIVLAKGAHLTAQRIVALARESNIPVIQNIPLARAIYKTVEIEHEIPPELYVAMAEVLSYVYKIRGNSPVAAMM